MRVLCPDTDVRAQGLGQGHRRWGQRERPECWPLSDVWTGGPKLWSRPVERWPAKPGDGSGPVTPGRAGVWARLRLQGPGPCPRAVHTGTCGAAGRESKMAGRWRNSRSMAARLRGPCLLFPVAGEDSRGALGWGPVSL